MLTGTEGELSVKLFGQDLSILNDKIEEIRNAMADIEGVADLQIEQTTGIPQLLVRVDRTRLARFGIPVGDVADIIETALNGIEATDVYEEDRITSVLIRLPEEYRNNEEAVKNLLVDAPNGQRIPLSELTDIRISEGPQTIFRENLMRRKIILCNIVDRDINGFVKEAQQKIEEEVSLPAGYFVTFGGQFESQQRALHHLATLMIIVILIIFRDSFFLLRVHMAGPADHHEHSDNPYWRYSGTYHRRANAQCFLHHRVDRPLRDMRAKRCHSGGQNQ